MRNLIESFTKQLVQAFDVNPENLDLKVGSRIDNILIIGMGGSGIGGSISSEVLSDVIGVPVLSCKDYCIPAFVSSSSLLIASSYSGNTEETLSALDEAEKKTKNIVCICSGGSLEKRAREKGYVIFLIPGGLPPRAALGYSFPQIFRILNYYGLLNWDVKKVFDSAINLIVSETEKIKEEAQRVAALISDKFVIIYSQSDFESVAVRFRQQLNENSKKLCWHHSFPEMNHNELVAWRSMAKDKAVILLRNKNDIAQNQRRMELSKTIFSRYEPLIIELFSKGQNKVEQALYFIHICDWISLFVADINKTDSMEIEVINYFKKELAAK